MSSWDVYKCFICTDKMTQHETVANYSLSLYIACHRSTEKRVNKVRHGWTSAQVINFWHFHGAEVIIWSQSLQPGAEVTRAEHRLPPENLLVRVSICVRDSVSCPCQPDPGDLGLWPSMISHSNDCYKFGFPESFVWSFMATRQEEFLEWTKKAPLWTEME